MKFTFATMTFIFWSFSLLALSEKEVVSSSKKHHPKVMASLAKVVEQSEKLKETYGAFDAKVKGEFDTRTKGYYDGEGRKVQIEKPLMYMNSKIYGGYRISDGDFPSYEGKMNTLDEGEKFVGLSVSLLRDFFIDNNRYKSRYQKEEQGKSQLFFEREQMQIQTMAIKAYWEWVVKGMKLKVYKELLGLAEKRRSQIQKRVKFGDMAKIYMTENNQYIVQRSAQVIAANMDYVKAANYLSLFYRGGDGQPIVVKEADLPSFTKVKLSKLNNLDNIKKDAIKNSFELKILERSKKQALLDRSLGKNNMLPKLNVSAQWSEDRGNGLSSLNGSENRIMLNMEIPIENRKGRGKKRAAEAKLKQIKIKKQFVEEKVHTSVLNLVTKINSYSQIYDLSVEQVKLSKTLALAERKKLNQGASDLLRVNLREENLAKAQIKRLLSLLKYHFTYADLLEVKVESI